MVFQSIQIPGNIKRIFLHTFRQHRTPKQVFFNFFAGARVSINMRLFVQFYQNIASGLDLVSNEFSTFQQLTSSNGGITYIQNRRDVLFLDQSNIECLIKLQNLRRPIFCLFYIFFFATVQRNITYTADIYYYITTDFLSCERLAKRDIHGRHILLCNDRICIRET